VQSTIQKEGKKKQIKIQIKNSSSVIAFMVNFKILDSKTQEEIKPAFYSENYLTLFPDETREYSVWIDNASVNNHPLLHWQGVNVVTGKQLCR
jgi:exo-1,4-beta-D-glucosaminidase